MPIGSPRPALTGNILGKKFLENSLAVSSLIVQILPITI